MNRPTNDGSIARRSAFTLVELLLGLVVFAMVGAAVASMMAAVSYGTDSSRNMRGLVGKQNIIETRMAAAIHAAHRVLAVDKNVLVLWTQDKNSDSRPGANELERIDLQNGALKAWTPTSTAGAGTYPLSSDFVQVTDNLMLNGKLASHTWARGVNTWSISLNAPAAQNATLVSWQMTLDDGTMTAVAAAATALRNREAP